MALLAVVVCSTLPAAVNNKVDACCRNAYALSPSLSKGAPVPKAVVLGIRMNEELRDALARAAAADQRSMSALASKVLLEWLQANGYPPKPAKPMAPTRKPRRPA